MKYMYDADVIEICYKLKFLFCFHFVFCLFVCLLVTLLLFCSPLMDSLVEQILSCSIVPFKTFRHDLLPAVVHWILQNRGCNGLKILRCVYVCVLCSMFCWALAAVNV